MSTRPSAESGARPLYVAEPPPQYATRRPAVVDASLIACVLFAEPGQDEAAQRVAACQPVAPDLLRYEIVNVAASKRRQGCDEAALRAALADLDALGIDWMPVDAVSAFDLAARYALSAYDAAYLAVAAQLRCPLLTFDRRLAEAARKHLDAAP